MYAGVSSIIIAAASIVIIIVVRLDKNLQRASVCVGDIDKKNPVRRLARSLALNALRAVRFPVERSRWPAQRAHTVAQQAGTHQRTHAGGGAPKPQRGPHRCQ